MADERVARRSLVIVERERLASGVNDNTQQPWTLFAVKATDPDGRPLRGDPKLRTFDDTLPIGEPIELVVKPYKNGESYTLERPGSGRRGAETRRRLDDHQQRIERLEGHAGRLDTRVDVLELADRQRGERDANGAGGDRAREDIPF